MTPQEYLETAIAEDDQDLPLWERRSTDGWDAVEYLVHYDGSVESYLHIQQLINLEEIIGITVNSDSIPFIPRFSFKWRYNRYYWVQIPKSHRF